MIIKPDLEWSGPIGVVVLVSKFKVSNEPTTVFGASSFLADVATRPLNGLENSTSTNFLVF